MASTLGDTDPHNLKLRRRTRLVGEYVVYDMDVGLTGEIPLQPEVTQIITNDGSDQQQNVGFEKSDSRVSRVGISEPPELKLTEILLSASELPESGVSAKLPESGELPQFLATESKEKKLKGKDSQGPSLSASNVSESFSEEQHESLTHPMTNSLPMILDMQQKINQMVNSQQENAENMIAALGARFEEEIKKTMLKEIARVASALARQATPIIEQAVFSAITESFQRGIGDKAVNQRDKSVNSKLETSRQVQAQFQTSGRRAIQEALRSSLESSVIPSLEMSCKTMFEQADSAFQKGVAEFGSEFAQLAHTLTEAAEALNRHLAAAEDPAISLLNLISEGNYNEAFQSALGKLHVSIVSWLCSQVNQGVLLSLLEQLALDISKDTFRKLGWMTDVLLVINPDDPLIVIHGRPILERVHQILQKQLNTPSSDFMAIRLMMHVISSLLMR